MGMHNLSDRVKDAWDEWELSTLMLFSFLFQILLATFGNRRKCKTGKGVVFLVWCAYTSADWVATVSLGIIARSHGYQETNENLFSTLWAPILLVHLAAPDTISAYSVEDNELWSRKLLEFIIQVGMTCYVLLSSWRKNSLILVAVPILLAGIIKHVKRLFSLWAASSKGFWHSTLTEMGILFPHRSSGSALFGLHQPILRSTKMNTAEDVINRNQIPPDSVTQLDFLDQVSSLFFMSKILFAGKLLDLQQQMSSYRILNSKDAAGAFNLIEVELGLMFDLLYTRVTKVSLSGIVLRFITLLSFVSALLAFSMISATVKCAADLKTNVTISYLLLVGGMVFEIYFLVLHLLSDWAMIWLRYHLGKPLTISIYNALCSSRLRPFLINDKKWSGSMAQSSLIKKGLDALRDHPLSLRQESLKVLTDSSISTNQPVDVTIDLKKMIFKQLKDKRSRYDPTSRQGYSALKELLAERGYRVLERKQCLEKFGWSVVDAEFDHNLLLWHIATDLCYHDDLRKNNDDVNNLHSSCKTSKSLSDYMFYLLSDCSYMLPKGNGGLRILRGASSMAFFLAGKISLAKTSTSKVSNFLFEHFESLPEGQKQGINISVLYSGCKLAKSVQSLETEDGWLNEDKWEMVAELWVEILTSAASSCDWKEHAKALNRGGELLSLVSLLMAHLGLSEQCRPEVDVHEEENLLSVLLYS